LSGQKVAQAGAQQPQHRQQRQLRNSRPCRRATRRRSTQSASCARGLRTMFRQFFRVNPKRNRAHSFRAQFEGRRRQPIMPRAQPQCLQGECCQPLPQVFPQLSTESVSIPKPSQCRTHRPNPASAKHSQNQAPKPSTSRGGGGLIRRVHSRRTSAAGSSRRG